MEATNQAPDLNKLNYPIYSSTKHDGIRALVMNGQMFTKRMEPLPNACLAYYKAIVNRANEDGYVLDCEIWKHKTKFNEIQSTIHDEAQIAKLKPELWVFDMLTVNEWNGTVDIFPFKDRVNRYLDWLHENDPSGDFCLPVVQSLHQDVASLEAHFNLAKTGGHEGLMLRCPESTYSHSRATAKQNIFWKHKVWEDSSAKIIGFKQAKQLTEEAKATNKDKDNLGRTKRGHKKGDRELVDKIGSIEIEIIADQQFPEGTKCFVSFAQEAYDLRMEVTESWANREKWLNKHVDITFMAHGTKDKPRMGRITRLRPDLDT